MIGNLLMLLFGSEGYGNTRNAESVEGLLVICQKNIVGRSLV